MTGDGAASGDLVLAVDGGGAKTDLALLDRTGQLRALVRAGGSHAHYLGIDGSVGVLEGLLTRAISRADLGALGRPFAATAQILLAGADLPEERAALHARIAGLGWTEQLVVDNDTFALLRTGTNRGWGVAVVCGAGINCVGRTPDGREVRFLSLGEISGDWGGGGDVGRAALAAAARSADGRGGHTVLAESVPAHFGLSDPLELARAIHRKQISETRLGELAPLVLAAAHEDPVAAAIIRRVADEVTAFACAALRRLDLGRDDPDVVLGGRLLRSLPGEAIEVVAQGVGEVAPAAHVLVSSSEPIVGAALLGLDALGADGSACARARAALGAAVEGLQRPGLGAAPAAVQ